MSFRDARLITEGLVFLSAFAAAVLLLGFTPQSSDPRAVPPRPPLRSFLFGCAAALILVAVEIASVRALYGDRHAGHSSLHRRFGPEATWRIAPMEKGKAHP